MILNASVVFESWYKRYEDLFINECKSWDEAAKVRSLLRKLGVAEHDKYCNFILPKRPGDFSLADTVTRLSKLFGERCSLFHTRYQCFQIVKDENDDFVTFAALVNRECERFKLKEMTDDQFKPLILVCGLKSPREADIRTRILSKLENDPNITLQSISEECQHLNNLKHDTAEIERQLPVTLVNAVKHNIDQRGEISQLKQTDHSQRPKTSCRQCGEWHFVKFCQF